MELPTFTDAEAWILRVTGFVTAFLVFMATAKKAYLWVKSFFGTVGKIQKIFEELSSNGGGSLKDAILRIENRMIIQEQKEKIVLQESKVPMVEHNRNGDLIWANRAYRSLTGRSLDELVGNGWQNCIIEADRKKVVEEWDQSEKDERDFEMEYRIYVDHMDETKKVKCKRGSLKDSNGAIIGWFGIVQEV